MVLHLFRGTLSQLGKTFQVWTIGEEKHNYVRKPIYALFKEKTKTIIEWVSQSAHTDGTLLLCTI